jgi:hypothetical protein
LVEQIALAQVIFLPKNLGGDLDEIRGQLALVPGVEDGV